MINPASFGYCPDNQLAKEITVAANNNFNKKNHYLIYTLN
jgi:hypothetical protein